MGGDHKCPVCSATFTRPQHVARHMRSHTGDRPYKCQHCGDQFARSDLLSRHVNKCHANEKPLPSAGNSRRKGSASATRATTSKQACDQCVQSSLPCDGCNPCAKCVQRKCRCTFVKFHRQTAPIGPGHNPRPSTNTSISGSLPNLSHLATHPVQFPPLHHHQQGGGNLFGSRVPLYSQTAHGGAGGAGDDFLLGPPPGSLADPHHGHGGVTSSGLYSHSFTFPPVYPGAGGGAAAAAAVAGADSGAGLGGMEVDISSDYTSKYRAQQAELLRRGSLPASYGSSGGGGGGGPSWLGGWHTSEPESSSASSSYSSTSALHELVDKDIEAAIARQMLVASANAVGAGGHHQVYGYAGQQQQQHLSRGRRASQDFSDGDTHSVPSSATSSNVHLPLVDAATGGYRDSQSGAYLSHQLNGRNSAHPPDSSSSSSSRSRPGTSHGEGGFSSAFGLMSLDDPNVLAGLSTDGAPFFSMIEEGNGDPNATPMPSKHEGGGVQTQHAHQQQHGTHHVRPSTGHGHPHGHGGGHAAQTPGTREAETRELREFWKQYMRTPLSGPGPGVLSSSPQQHHHHPSGQGPGQQTPGGDVNMLSPGLHGGPGGPLAGGGGGGAGVGGYRRPRVASLPSVKTPTAVEDEERFLYSQGYGGGGGNGSGGRYSTSNPNTSHVLPPIAGYGKPPEQQGGAGQGGQGQGQGQQGDSSMRTTLHGNVDDLKSYEAAVLARKAPTNLNLVPRIRKSKGGAGAGVGAGAGGASTSSVSPTMPVPQLSSLQQQQGQQGQHVSFVAPGTNPDSSLVSAFGLAGMGGANANTNAGANAQSPSSTTSSYSRESSVDENFTANGRGRGHHRGGSSSSTSMRRPSFKRLPSQTLESAYAKRALLTRDREGAAEEEEDDDGEMEFSGGSGGSSGESREGSTGGFGAVGLLRPVPNEQAVEDEEDENGVGVKGMMFDGHGHGHRIGGSQVYGVGVGGGEKRRRMSAPTKSPTELTFAAAGQI